ncbi:hypothetical protein AB0I28_07135 [Phytomonospora sp. NPDC050363]|uniref:hypothetical protein n=1 Tax=Phytomonospora sp. NPDC050363 TaxID=3155642 RepID=UPI0033D6A851
MADRPDLRVTPDSPDDKAADQLLSAAFSSYRAAAGDHFARTASPNLFGEAKRSHRRRVATLGAAVVGSLSLLVGGVAVATTVAYNPDPDTNATGGVGDDGGDPNNPANPGGLSVSASPNPDGTTSTVDPTNLRNAELTLPAWPGGLSSACPAGTFQFSDGVIAPTILNDPVEPPADASADPSGGPSTVPPPPVPAWRVLPGSAQALYANIDTSEGDELLVPVGCGDEPVHGLVALAAGAPMGFVHAGVDAFDQITGIDVTAGVIGVSIADDGVSSIRHYGWDGGSFVEVPAVEPTPPPNTPSGTPSGSPGTTDPTNPGEATTTPPPADPEGDGAQKPDSGEQTNPN